MEATDQQKVNIEKLKALQLTMDKIEKELWEGFHYENGRQTC